MSLCLATTPSNLQRSISTDCQTNKQTQIINEISAGCGHPPAKLDPETSSKKSPSASMTHDGQLNQQKKRLQAKNGYGGEEYRQAPKSGKGRQYRQNAHISIQARFGGELALDLAECGLVRLFFFKWYQNYTAGQTRPATPKRTATKHIRPGPEPREGPIKPNSRPL
jgi:hypothetical protein